MEGRFGKFTAQLAFDPAKLATAQARLDIALASLDTGVAEADQEAAGKLWFNTAAYPAASFVSSGIKALGGNRYEASGKLSIKGRTLEVVTPVTFSANGARGAFDGAFSIRRLDYKIGEGAWADVSAVANEVQIRFHLVVTAAPGKK
jgi:polyisoprenoid-binding protein YceI